ncbi:MAG: hypothetical protein B6D39_09540, partial [Anaerolineae bacterium UTCFX2]
LLGEPGTLLYMLGMLIANLLVVWITLTLLRTYARRERKRVGDERPIAIPDAPPAARVEQTS